MLLAASDEERLAALIETHDLDVETIEALKAHSATLYFDRPAEAARVAQVAMRLGDLLPEPAPALGQWTLANALLFADRYVEAVALYDRARTRYLALDRPLEAARMGVGHVWALAYTGQFERALALAEAIEPTLARAAETNEADLRRLGGLFNNLGITYDLLGLYEEALTAYDRKLDIAQTLGNELDVGRTHHNRACALTYLNAMDSALRAFKKAEAAFQKAEVTADLARLAYNRGTLYAQWGRYAEAEEQFAAAQERLRRLDGTEQARAALTVYRALAHLESEGGLDQQLLDALTAAQGTLAEHGPPFEEGLAWLARGRHHLAQDEFPAAEGALEQVLAVAVRGGGAPLTWQAFHLLGTLAEQRGDRAGALRHYGRAIEMIEAIRGELYVEAFRVGFVADKLDVFADLALLHARSDDLEEAFAVVDRAKSRLLAERLADRLDGEIASLREVEDPELRETADRLTEVLQQLEQLYRRARLDRSGERGELWSVMPDPETLTAVRQLEEEAVTLSRRLERGQPSSSPLALNAALLGAEDDGRPVQRLTSRLRGEKADGEGNQTLLLQYHVARDHVWAFVVGETGILAHRKLAPVAEVEGAQRRFSAAVERALGLCLSYGSEVMTRYLSSLLVDVDARLVHLYDLVVRPLERHLRPGSDLVIAPDGPLHHLPFHALCDDGTYLIERHTVSYTPSATVLALCSRPAARGEEIVVMGHAGEYLEQVAGEVEAVASLFPEAELLRGADATAARLVEKAPRCRMLHLAAHARFRSDRAMLSSFSLADRRLTLAEIVRLRLRADLVTLSACETGRGRRYGANLISLAGGFLGAGARSLLVSLWRVDDESTAHLMEAFYEALQGGVGRATALRAAQLELLTMGRDRSAAYGRYRHPAYWAPFALIGEWGTLGGPSPGKKEEEKKR
jgi:tetratricopeptide (TPR) repeat protein